MNRTKQTRVPGAYWALCIGKRAFCATNGPIEIGDLLVTTAREGFAMKSLPVEIGGVRIHRPGTLIGKALEPLAQGTGEILVLLSLQ